MQFYVKVFFNKCKQIRSCSHLPKAPLTENFIFCAVFDRENYWKSQIVIK